MLKSIGVLLLLLPFLVVSQEIKKENPVSFYGFVRNDFYLDTYKGLNAFQDVFYIFPNFIGTDAIGRDINHQMTANLLSVVTRCGVNINGPELFGAKTTGCIEIDFAGKPEIFLIRLRKAFTLLSWSKTKLLVGQTWHPMWGNDAYPRIGGLNTGSPFQPFNRSPQVRFDFKEQSVTYSLSAVYQQQYLSYGPLGFSNTYKRDAVIPEMVFGIEYSKRGLTLGAGYDFNRIKPRVTTTGIDSKVYVTDECLNSNSYMAYGKYTQGKLMMLLKGFYGQNLAHLTMVSGYGVSAYNTQTGKETYTNFNGYSTLLNITYGNKWKPGLLLGYLENLGTSDPLVNKSGKADVWGLAANIMNMYRICPSLSFSVPKFLLTAEYELTNAEFGVGQFNFKNGLYADTHSAKNNGVRLIMTWFF